MSDNYRIFLNKSLTVDWLKITKLWNKAGYRPITDFEVTLIDFHPFSATGYQLLDHPWSSSNHPSLTVQVGPSSHLSHFQLEVGFTKSWIQLTFDWLQMTICRFWPDFTFLLRVTVDMMRSSTNDHRRWEDREYFHEWPRSCKNCSCTKYIV